MLALLLDEDRNIEILQLMWQKLVLISDRTSIENKYHKGYSKTFFDVIKRSKTSNSIYNYSAHNSEKQIKICL